MRIILLITLFLISCEGTNNGVEITDDFRNIECYFHDNSDLIKNKSSYSDIVAYYNCYCFQTLSNYNFKKSNMLFKDSYLEIKCLGQELLSEEYIPKPDVFSITGVNNYYRFIFVSISKEIESQTKEVSYKCFYIVKDFERKKVISLLNSSMFSEKWFSFELNDTIYTNLNKKRLLKICPDFDGQIVNPKANKLIVSDLDNFFENRTKGHVQFF